MATAREIINRAAARAQQTKTIYVEEWGCDVTIRRLSLGEVQDVSQAADRDTKIISKMLFQLAVTDPPFTMEEVNDLWGVEAPGPVIEIVQAINDFNSTAGRVQLNDKEVTQLEAVAYTFPLDGAEQAERHEISLVPSG